MKQRPYLLAAGVTAVLVAIAGSFYVASQRSHELVLPAAPSPAASMPSAAADKVAAAAASGPRHPIGSVLETETASAPAEEAGLEDRLVALFGRQEVLSRLQLDAFELRIVATVDNLAREQAATRLWPVVPTPGRFLAQQVKGEQVISPDNGLRYTPYVVMLERVDLPRLAALYKRLYPRLQLAYEELGYPQAYFNDRVVAVIDHLLAAPEPEGLVRVHLAEVKGPVQPARPWVMYEYDDLALEALSSGHKIMLRMGPVNERRVKARLRELRPLLATGSPAPQAKP